MAGVASAGRLIEPAAAPAPAADPWLRLATRADDEDLRRLLRDSPVGGEIRLTFEREPGFFLAPAAEGVTQHTVIARDPSDGRLVGMGSRSILEAFVNGEPRRLGYLSQLRLAPACRGRRRLLAGGYTLLRGTRAPDEAPFDITTIVADNRAARRLLLTGVPGLPTYRPLETFVTLLVPAARRRPGRPGLTIERGSTALLPEIAACLDRNRRRLQFAPRWPSAGPGAQVPEPGPRSEDFLLAVGRTGVVGCVALWDQSAFKQVVVRGYGKRLARLRPWLNRVSGVLGLPRLPDPGQRLSHAFLSHLAVDDDSVAIFAALIDAARDRARSLEHEGLVLGLASRNPFLREMRRRFRARRYVSLLCAVHGEDGRRAVEALDDRIPHPEAALL
ncbi:MAG TPA: hypothetical protein VKF61_11845 [Candidatus Polarisedimenticolia bacterium]|nr:hypothetical protein [Candidatus Polarisedimenticolia bacterium]